MIHPEWLDDLHQRQDKQGADWVLEEISTALASSLHTGNRATRHPMVIPVLLERAELPNVDKLPEKIRKLADLKAFRFRSGSLVDDINRLIEELECRIPASWQPNPKTRPKKFDETPFSLIGMVTLAVVSIGPQAMSSKLVVTLLTLLQICMIIVTTILLVAVSIWVFGRQLYQAEEKTTSIPISPQSRLAIGLGILSGAIITPFYLYVSQNVFPAENSLPSAIKSALVYLIIFLILFLFMMSFVARALQEGREWPPWVPTQRVPDRIASLRGTIVLLERCLVSSWRPPLSRVQRDQAQHLVQELGKAAGILRNEAARGRLDWLRTEHRRKAIMYTILLIGTVGIAVASAYQLNGTGYTGKLLYLAALTPVLAPGMGFGTIELWFRYERRKADWLAAEIEESLEKKLLPYLPR